MNSDVSRPTNLEAGFWILLPVLFFYFKLPLIFWIIGVP